MDKAKEIENLYIKDKVFVVTGGGAGIGKNIVENVLQSGGFACVIDLDISRAKEEFSQYGEKVLLFEGDISKEDDLEKFVSEVKGRFPEIFCLVNNACKTHGGILHPASFDDFVKTLTVGVVAPYYLAREFQDSFSIGGSIVNISSTRKSQSQKSTESYSATKGGIASLTHALSVSLAGKVRVNSVSPGWIDTTNSEFFGADNIQHSVCRVGTPQDITDMVFFLASEKAGFITGQDFVVDGGMSVKMIYHGDEGWNLSE